MFKSKKSSAILISAVLLVGAAVGFLMARSYAPAAKANDEQNSSSSKVDKNTLEELYQAAFGRPVDEEGIKFHLGKDLKQVLNDINNSNERRYYSALFKSVKAYEEAVRAPGDLSDADKKTYLDNIDSALSTLIAWVETLPEQSICKAVVGIEEARQAIQNTYDNMSPAAKLAAQKGIFNALSKLGSGKLKDLPLPAKRCLVTPSPLISPALTPSETPTPTSNI